MNVYKKIKLTGSAFTLIFLMSGCEWMPVKPSPEPISKPITCPAPKIIERIVAKTGGKLNLPIIGEVEKVLVNPAGIWYDSRIDTGANSSSIHAEEIQLVERDGKQYVTFLLRNPATNALVKLERKLHRKVLIKQKQGKADQRYVVKLWLSLGDIKELVDVTLTNRSDFSYPLLVGRNLLTDTAIVDVSRKYTIR